MDDQIKMSNYIEKYGYKVNKKAFPYINLADDWYRNKVMPFHKRQTITGVDYELQRTNFGKRLCADDANLCEVIEINAQDEPSNQKIIDDILEKNNFQVMYRQQLEQNSAVGTVGAYIRVENAVLYDDGSIKGGKIKINYASAENIVILKCVNNQIIECAFQGKSFSKDGSKKTIDMFRIVDCKYQCITAYFDENDNLIEELDPIPLGEVPPFAIMRVAEVNNLEDIQGYGLPKLYNAISNLEILDLTYNLWRSDLSKSDKMVFLSKSLGKYNEKTGQYELPNEECKKIFMQITSKDLPQEGALAQEYNPVIRIDEVEKSMELVLSMLSTMFGYGTKKYTFEDGKFVTATEYIGNRQDMLQELNKQRQEATQYITAIIKAIRWFYNNLEQGDLPDDEITINFDDSYVTNKDEELKTTRDDAMSFDIPQLKIKYLCKKYGIDEKEAQEWLNSTPNINDDGGEE